MTKRKAKVDYSTDLPRRSVPQVSMRMEAEISRQRNVRGTSFFGPKVTGEALVNAILLHFLEQPEEDRDRIVDVYVKKFEAIVSLKNEKSPGEAGDEDDGLEAWDLEGKGEGPPKSPSGKKPKQA